MNAKEREKQNAIDTAEAPIATKLAAEPGWRVVTMRVVEELEGGLVQYAITVFPVNHWALKAPTIQPQNAQSEAVRLLFGAFGGFLPPSDVLQLWPIDPQTGKRFLGTELFGLYPPSDTTDEQLAEIARQWCADTLAEHKKSTP